MGEHLGSTVVAVDLPASRILPVSATRRHRSVLGTAGILLFICMFMPAMRGCSNSPVIPLDVPPFLPPYLFGLVFAAIALTRSSHGLITGVIAVRFLATLVSFAGFVVFLVAPSVGIVELTVGLVLLTAIGIGGVSELRLAATATLIGALCVTWFGLWTASVDALYGVHLSLVSSMGLLVGGALWVVEVLIQPAAAVPRAVVRRR